MSWFQRIGHLFLVLLPFTLIAGSGATDVTASLVALMFLLSSWRDKNWQWAKQGWFKLALLLWAYLLLRSGFALEPDDAFRRAGPWVRFPLLAAAMSVWLATQPTLRKRMTATFLITVSFVVADTIWQYILGSDVFGRPIWAEADGSFRLTGPLKAPKVGIIITWLLFPALLYFLAQKDRKSKAFGLVLAVLAVVAVFLSGERMALLLMLFGFGLSVLFFRAMRRLALPLGVIGGLAVAAVLFYNPAVMQRQIDSSLHVIEHYKDTPYGQIWQSAAGVVADYPLFGVGLKHFRIVCREPAYGAVDGIALNVRCNLHPHQLYLEWLTESGVVGLVLFLVVMVAMLKRVWIERGKFMSNSGLYVGLLIAIAIRLWPLSTAVSLFVAWSAVPLWFMLGWALALANQNSQSKIGS